MRGTTSLFSIASIIQGVYFLMTGIWPLISSRTFERVTGPKVDFWLVKTVGLLVGVIGAVLIFAGLRRRETAEVPILAIGSAASLAGVDLVYVAKKRISPVYILDALAEAALIVLWLFALLGRGSRGERIQARRTFE